MATYTYEQIYSDPKKAIIRSSADAALVGLRNGQEVSVVCDRKWGEFTPTDSISKPLTFKSLQNGSSVTLGKVGSAYGDFETSTDGTTWSHYTLNTAITLNAGDEVMFRSSSDIEPRQVYGAYFRFVATGKIEAWHNTMSLYRKTDFATYSSVGQYAFYSLFMYMKAAIVKAPLLPATTLGNDCYEQMFYYYCTALTKAPVLPAKHVPSHAYSSMFQGCSSLSEIECHAETFSSGGTATSLWLKDVSASGTFYKVAGVSWASGNNGIPNGWTVVEMEAQS